MGVFGTNPSQSISGLPPANREPPRKGKQDQRQPKKDQPAREGDHVELSHPADAPAQPSAKNKLPGKPGSAHIDLQG